MKTLLDNQMRFHQAAFKLQAYRQELLASNIANADTPHFKARDIDFKGALQNAISEAKGGGGVGLDTTIRHILPGERPRALKISPCIAPSSSLRSMAKR